MTKPFSRFSLLAVAISVVSSIVPASAEEILSDGPHCYTNIVPYRAHAIVPPPKPKKVATSSVVVPSALPGATDVFSFDESAFQTLPSHFVTVEMSDPMSGKVLTAPYAVSGLISARAREQGIDPLIIEIIIGHESAFNPSACSGVGAQGLMQLMPTTAADLGCTDASDPAQNIAAGTRYFADQYRRFGNLHLALAAYNSGPGNVETYGGVPPFTETINYVSSIALEYQNRRKRRA
jgi:soluble lytic murein transglycosylase-like protein